MNNIKCASIVNITDICKNKEMIDAVFKKCIKGYHSINASPINEKTWEDINSLLFEKIGVEVYSKSDGSHLSGMDIDSSLGKISNKSSKYLNKIRDFDISSYRLTTVCSEKNCGTPQDFISEIHKRKNFDYYSFILRDETSHANCVEYEWLLIPSNYEALDPSSYVWEPIIGKRGKNKDVQTGWTTNKINGCKMSIIFSMSSQLWIHIEMTEYIHNFIVANTVVSNKPIYNYFDIVDKLNI